MLTGINIKINEAIYIKNPESSDLGRKIVASSIDLIDELGFEHYNFRKLAQAISSTEASVYRYFESKHRLLLYLTSWYWGWTTYRMTLALANIDSPMDRLKRAIAVLTARVKEDSNFSHIDEVKLFSIVVAESSKAYLHKEVDSQNKAGVYAGYKQLVGMVSDIVLEINPNYAYPHMLISTVVEGAHHQYYFAKHLPGLTDAKDEEKAVAKFYEDLVLSTLQNSVEN